MSTQEIALRPQAQLSRAMSFDEMQGVAQMFVKSGMFQGIRDVAQAFVKIQAGAELGISPFASMKGIHIIQGSIAIGATLVAGRMKAWGYDWEEVQRDETACVLRIINPKGKTVGASSFTIADAKKAGLTGKDNWSKYPKSMLFARAITDAARTWAPEVFAGQAVYTAEELGADHTNADGEALDPEIIRGTRQDQKAVAERRIAELQATPATLEAQLADSIAAVEQEKTGGPPPPPVTTPRPAMPDAKPKSAFQSMLDSIHKLKVEFESLGARDRYYAVLGANGFEKSNEIRNIETGRNVYRELMAELRAVRERTPLAEQLGVSATDLPETALEGAQ